MEREIWIVIRSALRRLPRRWPRGAVYDNRQILAVLMWAALHDRSISWACRRSSWPAQAWRRLLPDQSTLSRRLRDPRLADELKALLEIVQRPIGGRDALIIVDGKPLTVARHSRDRDATWGWGSEGHARGYKLHALIDEARRVLAWSARPMNTAESVVARELVDEAAVRGVLPRGATLLGDASYDSNALYECAAAHGVQLIAPRRKANRTISAGHRQHRDRLAAIRLTEGRPRVWERLRLRRAGIERFFGTLACGAGLDHLPPWARRPHRVGQWVGAKLVVNAALAARRTNLAA